METATATGDSFFFAARVCLQSKRDDALAEARAGKGLARSVCRETVLRKVLSAIHWTHRRMSRSVDIHPLGPSKEHRIHSFQHPQHLVPFALIVHQMFSVISFRGLFNHRFLLQLLHNP